VNHTFQSALEAQNLDPWEDLLEEFGCRGDQPNGVVVVGWREPNVHGPIGTRIPQCTPHLVLQKVWDIGHISVHHEIRQITGVRPQLLQQLQTSKRHIRMMNRAGDEELRVGTTVTILQEVWE